MPIITPRDASPAAPASGSSPAQDARSRAIARLTAAPANSQETPVSDPSKVSPEEMSALTPSKAEEGQQDKVETPDESPKEVTKAKEEPLSTQYAVLARKEKALRTKVQELKAKEDALAAREAGLNSKDSEAQSVASLKDRLAKDPIGTLTELGMTYDQLTALALNPPKTDPATQAAFERMEAEIKALKDAQEDSKKKSSEAQSNAYKQAVNQIRNDAKQLIQADENFETIKETGSLEDVVELIEATFKADGILLSVEEACKEVEEHLVEEAMKIAKIKKIQARLAPKVEEKKPLDPKQPQLKTLTNTVSSTRPLTARERAIAAFKGEHNK